MAGVARRVPFHGRQHLALESIARQQAQTGHSAVMPITLTKDSQRSRSLRK
jgi:hypothetical protein